MVLTRRIADNFLKSIYTIVAKSDFYHSLGRTLRANLMWTYPIHWAIVPELYLSCLLRPACLEGCIRTLLSDVNIINIPSWCSIHSNSTVVLYRMSCKNISSMQYSVKCSLDTSTSHTDNLISVHRFYSLVNLLQNLGLFSSIDQKQWSNANVWKRKRPNIYSFTI